MTEQMIENVIEWIKGEDRAVVTLSNGNSRLKNKLRKLYETHKDDFKQFVENKDGFVCANIPLEWINIKPKAKRNLTDEQKEALETRFAKARGEI